MKGATWWLAMRLIGLTLCLTVISGQKCSEDSEQFPSHVLSIEDSEKNGAKIEIINFYFTKSVETCTTECCEKTYGNCTVSSFIRNQSSVNCYHFQCTPVALCSLSPSNRSESMVVFINTDKDELEKNESLMETSNKENGFNNHLQENVEDNKKFKPRKGFNASIQTNEILLDSNETLSLNFSEHISNVTTFNETKTYIYPRKGVVPNSKKETLEFIRVGKEETTKNMEDNVTTNNSDYFKFTNETNLAEIFEEPPHPISVHKETFNVSTTPTGTELQNNNNSKKGKLVMVTSRPVPVSSVTESSVKVFKENNRQEKPVFLDSLQSLSVNNETQLGIEVTETLFTGSQETLPDYKQQTSAFSYELDAISTLHQDLKSVSQNQGDTHVYSNITGKNMDSRKNEKLSNNLSNGTEKPLKLLTQETIMDNENNKPTYPGVTEYDNVLIHFTRVHKVDKKVLLDKPFTEVTDDKSSPTEYTSDFQEQPTLPPYVQHTNIVHVSLTPHTTASLDNPTSNLSKSWSKSHIISNTTIQITLSTPQPIKLTMPLSRTQQHQKLTTESVLNPIRNFTPVVSKDNIKMDSVHQTYDSSSVHLIIALVLGLLLLFTVLGLVGKRIYDTWQRRHYHRMDYLIEDFYNS
ncbi:uncharacterized protein LOC106457311 [Limulus polyphemus]|uniref:Uncharacterized protein LOC106457311 n=1 Tax=Limulus polyphemus TaxID=6850 RepID=A0ABM1S5I1_LIMPO|nr:uncharacterized protein LOC106457311 [Limulus polyphemus]